MFPNKLVLTEEEQKDLDARKEQFIERYKVIIEDLQLDVASYPQFVPNDKGTFDIIVLTELVDRKNQPVKSPFQI